jgi:threonine dehydrogenase-like Zn-dependent dehydrogenase
VRFAVNPAEAALAEPAAVAWRGLSRVRPRPGERVAVVGDGTVGLIAAHLLRLFSPAALVVAGQRPDQAGLAAALGATAFALAGSANLTPMPRCATAPGRGARSSSR